MLYKKYHRNYVRKFKKGVKLRYHYSQVEVTKEPYRFGRSIEIEVDNRYIWTIVSISGKILYSIYNVI